MSDPVFSDIEPLHLNDRHRNSYTLDADGHVIVKTSAKGEFQQTGLKTDWLITTMAVGDTQSPLPATALTGRNSVQIYNTDTVETLYIGPTGVTADLVPGTSSGWQVGPLSYFSFDVTASIPIYGIAETGKTITIQVLELA